LTIPPEILLLAGVALFGAAAALAAFVWAIRHGELDPVRGRAEIIFDDGERDRTV
jgi:cbb3-type cytochrome oxidase maturation protein